LRNHCQNTFHVRQLSSAWRDFQVDILDAEHGSVALDDLSAQVVGVLHFEGISDTALLYLTRGLDLRVLEVAMRACEGHKNDLAEEWYPGEEKPCGALCACQLCTRFVKKYAYVFMAVHAHALNLIHNPGVIVAILLRARLGNLAPHVLEEVLRQTLLLSHVVSVYGSRNVGWMREKILEVWLLFKSSDDEIFEDPSSAWRGR
jgi:hypothetical protein